MNNNSVLDLGDRGRSALPIGGARLPAYRDPASVLTNWGPLGADGLPDPGNMGRVRATMGDVSNGKVTKTFVVQSWTDGSHLTVRTGQLVFVENDPTVAGIQSRATNHISPVKMVTLGHLNSIIAKQYQEAIVALRNNAWPNGVTEAKLQNFDERQIAYYIGRPEAMNDEIEDDGVRNDLQDILNALALRPYYALYPSLIKRRWSFIGVVNNTTDANSIPDYSMSHRLSRGGNAIVANCVIGLGARTSNIWGTLKITRPVFLVWRRALAKDGRYGHPEIVPATGYDLGNSVSGQDTYYEDVTGRPAPSQVLCLGSVGNDSVNLDPSTYQIREAVNSGGLITVSRSAEAMAVLPQIQIQIGV